MKINQLLGASYGEIKITKTMDKVKASNVTAGIYPIIKNNWSEATVALTERLTLKVMAVSKSYDWTAEVELAHLAGRGVEGRGRGR